HSVVRQYRIAIAVRCVTCVTRTAVPAAHLERHDHALSSCHAGHRIADVDDFDDGLVTEGERPAQRDEARRQEEIDVAASHGERTNQGLCVAFEARLWNVAPLDLMGRRAGELYHSSLLRRRQCSIT